MRVVTVFGLFVFILPAHFVSFFPSLPFFLSCISEEVWVACWYEREREREKNREESDRSKRLEGLRERRKSKTGQRK